MGVSARPVVRLYEPVIDASQALQDPFIALEGDEVEPTSALIAVDVLDRDEPDIGAATIEGPQDDKVGALSIDGEIVDLSCFRIFDIGLECFGL